MALENGFTPAEAIGNTIRELSIPWLVAGVDLPIFSLKEVARTGREAGLTESVVLKSMCGEEEGTQIPATLEDIYGSPAKGNSREAAIKSAPRQRVARETSVGGRTFEETAFELGRGRLRIRPKI